MHCILCIVLYALYSMHVFELTLKLVDTDRPTDRQTDIVTYRAAIAAKNLPHEETYMPIFQNISEQFNSCVR